MGQVTIIGRAKAEAVGKMEREGKLRLLIEVMGAVAAKDSNVAKRFGGSISCEVMDLPDDLRKSSASVLF
ncbi:MAG: hypothetical protein ACUVXD_14565, partial [Thermodesulfobacteriota bacterium]